MTPPASGLRGAFCCCDARAGVGCDEEPKSAPTSKTLTHSIRSREINMPAIHLRSGLISAALAILAVTSVSAADQKKYDTGATDTEIKIGNIMPYSGPASSYSVIGKTEAAYFNKINAEGGINGHMIDFISYDDGYSPPKTVEQA